MLRQQNSRHQPAAIRSKNWVWIGMAWFVCLLTLSNCAALKGQIKEDWHVENNYAVNCLQTGLWNEAKLHLHKALTIDKNKAAIYNNLGVVYEYFNLNDKAKEAYAKAVELCPEEMIYQKNLISFEADYNKTPNKKTQPRLEKKSKRKLLIKDIFIERSLEPTVKITGRGRVALFPFFKDEESKKAAQIALSAFKMNIAQESPFYLLEEDEIKAAMEGIDITLDDLEKKVKKAELCQILEVSGLFIVQVNRFTDLKQDDFDVSSYYSAEKKGFIYSRVQLVKRTLSLEIVFWLFNDQGEPLWHKEYNESAMTTYRGNDVVVPEYDKELLYKLVERPTSDFLSSIRPQQQTYKRIVVMER